MRVRSKKEAKVRNLKNQAVVASDERNPGPGAKIEVTRDNLDKKMRGGRAPAKVNVAVERSRMAKALRQFLVGDGKLSIGKFMRFNWKIRD